MLRTVSGTIEHIEENRVVVNVMGLGLSLFIPARDASSLHIGNTVTFQTYLALREHAVDLYGFSDTDTLSFFELLLSVSGVGPRSALGIVNLAPVGTLTDAIRARDIEYLTRVAGVGKKMAEKIVLELKDKVGGEGDAPLLDDDTEILDTLIALGYKEREAKKALQGIPNTITGKDARLKAALKQS